MAADNSDNRDITAKPKGKPRGRPFQAGNNANPKGRPKVNREGREMLRMALPDAVQKVIDTMNNPEAKTSEQLQAANIIIERVMGKSPQPIIADMVTPEESMTLREMMDAARELIFGDD